MVLLWQENGEKPLYGSSTKPKRSEWSHVDVDSQDTADLEWMMWFSTFKAHILFALSGHVLFAKICSMLAVQVILLTGGGCTKGRWGGGGVGG